MKILYIEDDKDVRASLLRFFRLCFERAEVVTAEDYADAIATLNECGKLPGAGGFDVVVSDFDLRRGTGGDVLDWCYLHKPWLVSRFIFLTGREQKDVALKARTESLRIKLLGHPHWLVKPTAMPVLEAMINSLTGG